MRIWRIVKEARSATVFDGEGARLFGGRYNSRGTRVSYTSTVLSLAVLEILVHLDRTRLLHDHVACSAHIDDGDVLELDEAALPLGWRRAATPAATQRLGDLWIKSQASLALAVPSVLLPHGLPGEEWNVLVNPGHERISSLEIGPALELPLDRRL